MVWSDQRIVDHFAHFARALAPRAQVGMGGPLRVLRWKAWPLAWQILATVLTILVFTIAAGGFLFSQITGQNLEQQYQLRALSVAVSVSKIPAIITALEAGDPSHTISKFAEKTRSATGVSYVVIADRDGIRYSHPDPALIGKRLQEGVIALDGKTHTRVDPGDLGKSANGIAPIFNSSGRVIGEVSVGIFETQVNDQLAVDTGWIIAYSLVVLVLSALGSIVLAWRIKRVTFGLEPGSIASLLQEREALLHGIREGMVGFDISGRVTVVNSEAKRLLGLSDDIVGKRLDDVMADGRLREVLTGRTAGIDEPVLTDDFLLVVNFMPVSLSGRSIGSVVTVRDRTEVEGLVRELHAINGLSEALRAQEHDYANHLFVIVGLIEMGDYEQVAAYVAQISNTQLHAATALKSRIEPPELAALILAKIAIAAEQGVSLTVPDNSHLSQSGLDPSLLVTIVGNLIDNAIEALAMQSGAREISVTFSDADWIRIIVVDNGPGVTPDNLESVFTDGYSTKSARNGMRRGIGLAIVRRIVRKSGGTIEVFPGPGGRFEVCLPKDASPTMLGRLLERTDRT